LRTRRLDDYLRQLGAAARSKEVDVEALLRKAIQEAVREALEASPAQPTGSRDGSLRAELEELRKEVAALREEVSKLREEIKAFPKAGGRGLTRSEVEQLAQAVAAALGTVLRQVCRPGAGASGGGGEEPRWLRVVRERLRDRGYVFLHEMPPEVRQDFDPEEARRRGLVVAPLAGSYLVATRDAVREFEERLRGLRTSDEYEAEARLGKYRLLFRVLRGEGAIYYAGPSRGWVVSLPGLAG